MRRHPAIFALPLLALLFAGPAAAQDPKDPNGPKGAAEESFYAKSLHYTNRGLEFIFSKEHGGVERLTGLSAEQAGCLKSECHVRSCDVCHRKADDGKSSYSVEQARTEEACAKCHPREKDDPDVHFRRGMKCMACHTSREIHGDGTEQQTYMKPGFFEARCETCHPDLPQSASHTVHGGRLDCGACHTTDLVTCVNCHFDSRGKGGKNIQIQKRGLFFLVNHGGKVKIGNFLSYVSGDRTMITLAPVFPHSIGKKGRSCDACHATPIVRAVKDGTFAPFTWEGGDVKGVEGVIPVVEGMKWNVPFLRREGDTWVPLEKPQEPLVNFSGYCTPLSRDQLGRLEKPRKP